MLICHLSTRRPVKISPLISPARLQGDITGHMAVITVQLIVTSVNISACYPGLGRKEEEESTCAFYSQSDTCSARGVFQCRDCSAREPRGRERVMRGRRAFSVIHVLVSFFNSRSTDPEGTNGCLLIFFFLRTLSS